MRAIIGMHKQKHPFLHILHFIEYGNACLHANTGAYVYICICAYISMGRKAQKWERDKIENTLVIPLPITQHIHAMQWRNCWSNRRRTHDCCQWPYIIIRMVNVVATNKTEGWNSPGTPSCIIKYVLIFINTKKENEKKQKILLMAMEI